MSIAAMTHVWEHSQHAGGTLLVLLALADYADDQGHSFPSVKTLGRKSRLSERQVQRAIQELIDTGELLVLQAQGRNGTNLYRIIRRGGDKMSGGDMATEKGGDVGVTQTVNGTINTNSASGVEELMLQADEPKRTRGKNDLFTDLLPQSWLSFNFGEAWKGYVEMRRVSRAPLTDHAVKLNLSELKKLTSHIKEPKALEVALIDILNQSTQKNYKGVFPVKKEQQTTAPTAKLHTKPEKWDDFIAGHPNETAKQKFARWENSSPGDCAWIRSQFNRWLKTNKYE